MKLTLSVRSFHVPDAPAPAPASPSFPSVPTSRATRLTSRGKRAELVDHRVERVLELEDLAFDADRDLARQMSPRAMAVATPAMLRTRLVRLEAIEFRLYRPLSACVLGSGCRRATIAPPMISPTTAEAAANVSQAAIAPSTGCDVPSPTASR